MANLIIKDYRLTTAEILYRFPDHPSLLQSFVWQKLDIAPEFPVLHKFLDYWDENIEAVIHSVHVANRKIVDRANIRGVDTLQTLH